MEAIYSRQSVDKKDSVSIETQISLCRRHANGEVLVFQDKGFSGKNTNRPGFRRLMDAVEAGRVRKIIVYRLDRFSRSIADFGQI
ncbi:MAG: recombinase family protein [Clostridium sp.]|nr:recombinase family protein [Clostridium sp.]